MNQRRLDLLIVLPLLGILALGLTTLSSALSYNPQKFYVQLVWVALSATMFLIVTYRSRRTWENLAIPLYLVSLLFLFLVLIIGKKVGGAYRWLDLGFMNFQPSELAKVAIILFLSYRLNQKPTLQDGYKLRDLIPETVAVLLSMMLVYAEPDLGTSLLIGAVSLIIIFSTKINRKRLIALFLIAIVSAPLLWEFVLADYQKRRVTAIVTMMWQDTGDESRTSQYHTKQSMIAVGSGRTTGKGYNAGTQNILRFIPEHHTDFIFSVYAEEFGFSGCMLLLGLYLLLFYRTLEIIPLVRDKFMALVVIGTVSLLWLQVVINIGMVSGVLPVVGIPLPFFSYGGSALLANSILMGLVHNFSINSRYR
ncbi:MAG TPA: rod shape-determining protein RodA [bacterium]|nr:rod shape-determining protein RodA [bacterium]